ncbi:hypothetical protein JCM10908_003971 [Rhodotorula pacifica]|uniref:5-formyltetrahydrofolate cyclo-ligase n=1 Tax=Rhodotorula pacifica TaxID=1495444 RepID=UPI00317392CF
MSTPAVASLTSGTAVQQAKKQLRKRITARLRAIPPDSVQQQSQLVLDRLFSSPYYRSARSISCYLSLPHSEIQTDSLIRHALQEGKRIYVPFCPVENKTEMRMVRLRDLGHFEGLKGNRWGIREVDPLEVDSLEDVDRPRPTSQSTSGDSREGLDLLILPGLAFDPHRRRLGHGRGYYDRYINTYCLDYASRFGEGRKPPRLVALALREQILRPGPATNASANANAEDGEGDETIPTNEWDRLADEVITPDEVFV